MLFPTDDYDCVANFDLPLPDVTDVCSDSWTIVTQVLDANGDVVLVVEDGANRGVSLETGDYTIRYLVTDDCGNTGTTDCVIRVADTQEPAAICISDINVSVGGYGIARIYSQMVDLGSYDNCGIDSMLVRRQILVDPITGDSLTTPIWSEWGPYALVECSDAGNIVVLQLRVVDIGGNSNICTTSASVVDNTLPYCTGLEDLFLSCTDLPADLDVTDSISLQAVFGKPTVVDNCSASAIELSPIINVEECSGAGTVMRRWLAIDEIGNVSAQEFTQLITITPDQGFTLVLPKDTLTDCLETAQGFEIFGQSCADISVTYVDTMVTATAADGDACLVIERKYTILNNCTFDPAVDQLVEISRDEDCNGVEGEFTFYALIDADSTFIDADTSITNAIPIAGTKGTECDGETNRTGIYRAVANTGGWTYTQRIAIFDETRPELIYNIEDTFCASEETDCETMIRIPITVAGECTAVGANWLVLVDLGRDGSPEMRLPSEAAVQGTFPNYFIEASLPIGEHTLMLRYVDGCQNPVAASVPFSILDCTVPDPTCYSGLIANLETLATPVVQEDGTLIETGVYVDAGRLASCNIEDCSGPLRFSVNRIGEAPHVDSTDLLLTCEDRYTVDVEVYMWDSAFNPESVQPDGTVGGPNWKMCVVEVLVQDPDELCNDCNADGSLVLGGNITLASGIALPNVEVELNGTANSFELSNDEGKYTFSGIAEGDYTIKPFRVDEASNGISTLDELILQRHLLGIQPITDPYMFLAADLNGSGTITVLDRLLLRKIILGDTDAFPGNETWRFVPATYRETMGEELARMAAAPREIKLTDVIKCANDHDFIGVKLGDLNNSVFIETSAGEVLNGTRGRSSNDPHPLEIEERRLQGGELFDLPVRVKDIEQLGGLQFTLGFSSDAVTVEEVIPGLLSVNHLGLTRMSRGQVSASWTQPLEQLDGEATLFTVRLRSQRQAVLSEVLNFADQPTFTEAYRAEDDHLVDLYLNFTAAPGTPYAPDAGDEEIFTDREMHLEQNFPNPFVEETTIRFDLPEAGEATISILDLHGRVLTDITREFAAGPNTVTLDGNKFISGVFVYTLTYKGERLTRSMIRR